MLKAMHLSWPKMTFSGIIDLRIGYMGPLSDIYYLDHLLAILSSNPLICILHLPPSFDSDTHSSRTLIRLPHLELLEIGRRKPDYSLLSKLEPGAAALDLRLGAPQTEEHTIAMQAFSERLRIISLTMKIEGGTKLPYLRPCISSMPHLRTLFLDVGFSRAHILDYMESALLTGYVPYLESLPVNDYGWCCSANLPNLKIIGLAPGDTTVLQLAPLVTAYSLDLLVLVTRLVQPRDPPCLPYIWNWVPKHVKSTALVKKDSDCDVTRDPWDSFMEILRLE
ncbi:hypothetical protein FRC08_001239 [Ceratobasidium sp. 394]|nr:hypothetical protein FRC08_001239 [Ceratobasidium sp. 394]